MVGTRATNVCHACIAPAWEGSAASCTAAGPLTTGFGIFARAAVLAVDGLVVGGLAKGGLLGDRPVGSVALDEAVAGDWADGAAPVAVRGATGARAGGNGSESGAGAALGALDDPGGLIGFAASRGARSGDGGGGARCGGDGGAPESMGSLAPGTCNPPRFTGIVRIGVASGLTTGGGPSPAW
jgi:hypothetical protein